MLVNWEGVFPAVTTKMTKAGAVDLEATQRSVDRLIANGVSGVIMLPMLGENTSLTLVERESVIRAAVEVVAGRVPILSGLAETTLADARTNAANYQSYGAQGLMVFPSIGYRSDARETAEWYRQIASASSLPMMLYNNPIAYGVDVTTEVLGMLADVEEIVCVKEESAHIHRATDIFVAHGDRFKVFCGVDDVIVESLALGVTGWVSGMTNVWPKECVEIFNLCSQEKFAEARKIYRIMTPAMHLDTHIKLVQYIKLAESMVYGAPEWARTPRLPLIGAERDFVTGTVQGAIDGLARYRAA
jgi:4-hydroxy-tetrahydrodipicolinate synthase